MYKAKHTPAPWNKIQGIDNTAAEVRSQSGVLVATVFGNDIECTKANTHLIAAAPELLAALYSAKSFIEAHDETHHDGATMGPTYATICAAITKAKGE